MVHDRDRPVDPGRRRRARPPSAGLLQLQRQLQRGQYAAPRPDTTSVPTSTSRSASASAAGATSASPPPPPAPPATPPPPPPTGPSRRLHPGPGTASGLRPLPPGGQGEDGHRGQLGGVGLGRGDGELLAGLGDEGEVGDLGEGGPGHVGDRDGTGAAAAGPLEGGHDLLGGAGLGDRHRQDAAEVEVGAVGGGQRGEASEARRPARAEQRYCPYTAALSEEPLAMNRTCWCPRPSASSSPTWASSASKVLLQRLRLLGDLDPHPARHTTPRSGLVQLAGGHSSCLRERWRVRPN